VVLYVDPALTDEDAPYDKSAKVVVAATTKVGRRFLGGHVTWVGETAEGYPTGFAPFEAMQEIEDRALDAGLILGEGGGAGSVTTIFRLVAGKLEIWSATFH
jgi:hypothetical protein